MTTNTLLKQSLILGLACATLTGCLGLREEVVPPPEKHLVFEEIFWVGTHYSYTTMYGKYLKDYAYDNYIKINNPTDHVIYLDSLCLGTSAFVYNTTAAVSSDNNFTTTHTAVSNILMFPGTGKDYPIKPGETKLIAACAIDHSISPVEKGEKYRFVRPQEQMLTGMGAIPMEGERSNWEKAADLSGADFEWLTKEQLAEKPYELEDTNQVPNMIPIFQGNFYNVDGAFTRDYGDGGPGLFWAKNTKDEWVKIDLNEFPFKIPENRSVLLFKLPVPVEELDQEAYWWDYEGNNRWHPIQLPLQKEVEENGWPIFHKRHTIESTHAVKLPNEWIIDAVTICAQKDFKRQRLADTVDAGYASVKESSDEKPEENWSGYALFRRNDGEGLIDNNNSTVDFEKRPASMLKEKPPVLLYPNITMKVRKVSLTVGDEPIRMKWLVKPKRSKNRKPTWTSSDESVATVDAKGFVTPVGPGTATITATLPNGASDTCEVTVKES